MSERAQKSSIIHIAWPTTQKNTAWRKHGESMANIWQMHGEVMAKHMAKAWQKNMAKHGESDNIAKAWQTP